MWGEQEEMKTAAPADCGGEAQAPGASGRPLPGHPRKQDPGVRQGSLL